MADREALKAQLDRLDAGLPGATEFLALRALTPAQAAGLAAGTHVVVPVEAVDPWHIWCFLRGRGAKCEKFRDEFEDDGLGEDLRAWAAAQKEG